MMIIEQIIIYVKLDQVEWTSP